MSFLNLTFVGSGDAFSSGGRLQSALLLETAQGGLLLDCGATLLAGLQRCELNTNQIDAIAVSHLHGDHFGGIPFLLLDALFVQKRTKPLAIIGPQGLENRVRELCHSLYPGALDQPFPFAIDYHQLDCKQKSVQSFFTLQAFPARHGQHSAACSLRIELASRTLAYSGDTAWTPHLLSLARATDLFICECCSYTPSGPAHLDYQTLSQHLDELETARIILTHTGPTMDHNRQHIDLEIAHDGLQLQL